MKIARSFIGVVVLALVAIGLTVLASAGEVSGIRFGGSPHHFLLRQVIWIVPALIVCAAAIFIDYHVWLEKRWFFWGVYIIIAIMMMVVLLCPAIKGSHRWIAIGSFRVQPGELAKLMTVVTVAYMIVKTDWKLGLFWRGTIVVALVSGIFPLLAICEPDFGSTMVMGFTMAALFVVGGVRWLHLLIIGGLSSLAFLTYLSTNSNRMRRILAWMPDTIVPYAQKCLPWIDFTVSEGDAQEANHQLNHAFVAIRRGFEQGGVTGAWTGVGFNNSMQKQLYLPENHTDFIFAIGAEEWGLSFSLLTLLLFTILFVFGTYIAWRCQDRFGRLLTFGVSFLLFFQVLFNVGVVTGLLPTKGIALPFMSYGGTNLVSALAAAGILYGVARRIDLKSETEKSTISRVFYR